jgi:hypothetical protein
MQKLEELESRKVSGMFADAPFFIASSLIQLIENDHVHDFGSSRSKIIVIYGTSSLRDWNFVFVRLLPPRPGHLGLA